MGRILIEGIGDQNEFSEWLCPLIRKDTVKSLPSVLSVLSKTELYPLTYNIVGRKIYPKDFYTAMLLRGFHIPGLFLKKDRQRKDRLTGLSVQGEWTYWNPSQQSLLITKNKLLKLPHLDITYIEELIPYKGSLKKLEDYKQKVRDL